MKWPHKFCSGQEGTRNEAEQDQAHVTTSKNVAKVEEAVGPSPIHPRPLIVLLPCVGPLEKVPKNCT
jgi:hypothetical protein